MLLPKTPIPFWSDSCDAEADAPLCPLFAGFSGFCGVGDCCPPISNVCAVAGAQSASAKTRKIPNLMVARKSLPIGLRFFISALDAVVSDNLRGRTPAGMRVENLLLSTSSSADMQLGCNRLARELAGNSKFSIEPFSPQRHRVTEKSFPALILRAPSCPSCSTLLTFSVTLCLRGEKAAPELLRETKAAELESNLSL